MSPSAPKDKSPENSPGCSNEVKGLRLEKKINELMSKLKKAEPTDTSEEIEKSPEEAVDNDYDSIGIVIRGSFITPETRSIVFRNPAKKHVRMKIELSVTNSQLLDIFPSDGIIEHGGQIEVCLICYPPTCPEDYGVIEYVTATFTEDSNSEDKETDKVYFPVIHVTPLPTKE